jgi:hypothetical protein
MQKNSWGGGGRRFAEQLDPPVNLFPSRTNSGSMIFYLVIFSVNKFILWNYLEWRNTIYNMNDISIKVKHPWFALVHWKDENSHIKYKEFDHWCVPSFQIFVVGVSFVITRALIPFLSSRVTLCERFITGFSLYAWWTAD